MTAQEKHVFEEAASQLAWEFEIIGHEAREELDNYTGGIDEIPFSVARVGDDDFVATLGNREGFPIWGSSHRAGLADSIRDAVGGLDKQKS